MEEVGRIGVMIVDDHASVREGLATVLENVDGVELVAEASNGKEAIRLCAQERPDVVLMDLKMPEMNGIEATQAILRDFPHVRVIVLTSFLDEVQAQVVLETGAVNCLLKSVSGSVLKDAIRTAVAGATISAK
jgi:DNA-binding NarL/FixJ family response regulator